MADADRVLVLVRQQPATASGVIFMALCASLFRQFEFIQQQWVQYGAVFNAGNDTDPLAGPPGPVTRELRGRANPA